MPKYTTTTTITTGRGDKLSATKSGNYSEVFNRKQEVDDTASFITILSAGKTITSNTLRDAKSLMIKNTGSVAAEIQIKCYEWATNLAPTTLTNAAYQHFKLNAGEYMLLPNMRNITSVADSAGSRGSATKSNIDPADVNSGNLYSDSTADVDSATAAGIVSSNSATTLYLEPYTSAANCTANLFKVGDIIRVDDEIMEVTAIGDKSDLANNYLTVKRGMFGSAAATNAADEDPVRFPFFNMTGKYNKYSTLQTDDNGELIINNLLGFGRSLTNVADGFSFIAGKFYTHGYQELGLTGITADTPTGIAASTALQFTIAVDGGSAYDLDVTTDASNGTFASGANSLLAKIQDVFNTQYYTSGSNLFQRGVTVSLVGGDVRFTSSSRLSTSAISLADSSGGDTDIWAAGRIPAVANIEGAVASYLPHDTVFDTKTNNETPNSRVFFYDDGHGNIHGACQGTFDYERGRLHLVRAPKNAHFALSWDYGAVLGGGNKFGSTYGNSIDSISARSVNSKINTSVEIVGLK